MNMKIRLLTGIAILAAALGARAQENELHAFELRHEGVYPAVKYTDNPPYTNYNISLHNAPQNEPTIRISRANPNIVVAAWRDFRLGWTEPNVVRRIGYAWSHDGGYTWSESQLIPDPLPNHLSQSDPVLTSDSEGNFYLSSTSRQPVTNYNREMLLYKSTDDGESFELHAIAVPGSGQQGEDKEWIFCDPVATNPTYDHIFIVWRSFGPVPKIMFRKSEPGGAVWSPTVEVSDGFWGQGANVASGTNGAIYVVWWNNGLLFDRSFDGGISFGTDTYISTYNSQINTTFPFICVDYSENSSRGNVYVVWADRRGGTDDIWFQRSTDHGDTWMPQPVRVNDAELNQQYWPAIQCDDNGRIVVTYYDEREGPGNMNTYLAYSDDQGSTWTNIRLNDVTFSGTAPNYNVRFGDYIHIDAHNGRVIPVWTDDRAGTNLQEIYTAIIDLPQSAGENNPPNETFTLRQNYPNPFTGYTNLHFELHEPAHVLMEVFNASGQRLDLVIDKRLQTGHHQLQWEAGGLAPGIYFLKLTSGKAVARIKMTAR